MGYRVRGMSDLVKAAGDPLIGTVIDDRYRILRVIGRGGMGVVYDAEATRLGDRLCAVKVLLPEFTLNETAVARFRREAQVAARVKHPNVVEIFDTGATPGGLGYIAMELLSGETLDRTLRREGPLPWSRAARILLQICRALAAAHAQKIVHRDMKPENCFRCGREGDDDFIKVLDFGIAKLTNTDDAGLRLTATNSVVGTYAYMSFEQVRGEEVDHRADVWAVGVILYEMLTGVLPFRGTNQGQIWTAITHYEPEPLRNIAPGAMIPDAVEAIVRQALAKPLSERYPTIEALARAIAGVHADAGGPDLPRISRPQFPTNIDPLATTGNFQAARERGHPHPIAAAASEAATAGTNEVLRTAPSPGTNPYGRAEVIPSPRGVMETANANLLAVPDEPTHASRSRPRRKVIVAAIVGVAAAAFGGIQLLRPSVSPPVGQALIEHSQVEPRVGQIEEVVQPSLPTVEPDDDPTGPAVAPLSTPPEPPAVVAPVQPSAADPPVKGQPIGKARRPGGPTTPTPKPPPPESVTVEHLHASITLRRADLDKCRDMGGYAGMRLQVDVTVDPSGLVIGVKIHKPYQATELGQCVADVLRSSKLPRSTSGGELRDTITL